MYKLSPSKAHRFLNCTQSLAFDIEFAETPATIRGNILHKFAEMAIKNEDATLYAEVNGINDYEYHLITSYVNAVWNEYKKIDATEIQVENKQPIVIFGNNINLIIDTLMLSNDTASIVDLKTGNTDVDVKENEQLYFYAYSVTTKYPNINTFRLSIFQKGKLKTIVKKKEDIFDFFIDRISTFDAIAKNELTYNPGDKQCKFCAIKDTCLARAEWIIGGK